MKLFNLLLVLLLFCTACGDDEDKKASLCEGDNCLTAVIDGEDFVAETTTGAFVVTNIEYEDLGNQETRLLTINGVIASLSGDTEIITLTFACSEFTSDLDYVNTDTDCGIDMRYQVASFFDPTSSQIIYGTSGNINIEDVSDNRIRGTFTFKGENSSGAVFNITDGFFDTSIE